MGYFDWVGSGGHLLKNDSDDGRKGQLVVMFRGRGVIPGWPEKVAAAQRRTTVEIEGQVLSRLRYGAEGRGWASARVPCSDCAAIKGEFHVPGCDLERCPACKGQAISCGCIWDRPAFADPDAC